MMAAEKRMFGRPMYREGLHMRQQRVRPPRRSHPDHQLPRMIPRDTPSSGSAAMKVLPRNLPMK